MIFKNIIYFIYAPVVQLFHRDTLFAHKFKLYFLFNKFIPSIIITTPLITNIPPEKFFIVKLGVFLKVSLSVNFRSRHKAVEVIKDEKVKGDERI